MKKNMFFLLIFLITATTAHSTIDSLSITLKDNHCVFTPQKDQYNLPLHILFSPKEDFLGKTIEIQTNGDQPSLVNLIFEQKTLSSFEGRNNFCITLNADSTFRIGKFNGKLNGSFNLIIAGTPLFKKPVGIAIKPKQIPSGNQKDTTYKPGYILYDALKLQELYNDYSNRNNPADLIVMAKILEQYNSNANLVNQDLFLKDITSHVITFKRDTTNNNLVASFPEIGAQSKTSDLIQSFASTAGGLDVTNIADGFARFIVKRTKQELSIAFFDHFKKTLNAYPDLQVLYPNTVKILHSIDQEIYNYSHYINNLREAFRSDLNTLDEHLPGLIPLHQPYFDENRMLAISVLSACYISTSIKHEMHPGDMINCFPDTIFNDTIELEKNLKGSVQLLQLLSYSLKERSSDTAKSPRYWVNIDKVRDLVDNKNALKYYLGLLLLRAETNYGKIGFCIYSFYDMLNTQANVDAFDKSYSPYKMFILGLGSRLSELNTMVKNYSSKQSDSLKVEQYARFCKTSVQFVEYCTSASELPFIDKNTELKGIGAKLASCFDIAYQTCDLTSAINRKRYPEAINHLVSIYHDVMVAPDKLYLTNNAHAEASKWSNTIESCLKYGAFMAGMVTAKSSEEVESVIETAALPTGSARIKRETAFNVSLNAYCGLFAGYERIEGVDPPLTMQYQKINSFGVSAPIGVSISRGHSVLFAIGTGKYGWKKGNRGWSSTLFFSIVDLGAITSFRFQNDSVASIPTIRLADIISPGIFYSQGIPGCPLSVNVGWQMGPLLRSVSMKENTYSSKYTRVSVSLCVDLPLFNLYSRAKERPFDK